MSTNSGNFGELLEPGLRYIYGEAYKQRGEQYSRIFDVRNSTKSVEHTLSMSGFGLMPTMAEGKGVTYDDALQGYKTNLTNVTYGLGFIVTLVMYEDDLYNKINALPKALARSGVQTVEITAANILNNGFTSTTVADGQYVFSTSHPLIGGGTLSNKLAVDADLSMTSFEQSLIDIAAFTDDRGLLINAQAKKLIIAPSNDWTATQLLGSEKDPESNFNAINPAMGKVQKEVNNYLTDPDAWFIKTDVDNGLVFYWRRRPAFSKDNDHDSDNAKYKTTMRFVCGVDDFRGIYASSGG